MVKLKKSYYIIFSIALVLLIGIIILVVFLTIPQNASENVTSEQTHFTSNPNSSQESTLSHNDSNDITTMTSQSDIYTIKEYKGHIGVFLNDETQPYKEVNVSLSALPTEDQELLKKGITANSQGEVQIILEDYIS